MGQLRENRELPASPHAPDRWRKLAVCPTSGIRDIEFGESPGTLRRVTVLNGISAAFAPTGGEAGARAWYHPDMTRVHNELHAADLESENPRSSPIMPETNVDVHVRALPAFSARSQIHLAPSRHAEGDEEENDDRPGPGSIIPMTTSSISPGAALVVVP